MNKPILYMLIGLPGSGKSTWILNNAALLASEDQLILSTDDFVQAWAEDKSKTYDEVFAEAIKPATKAMQRWVDLSRKFKIPAIWDQTNLTRASRAKKLQQLPDHHKVAVVFQADAAALEKRRAERPGKTIPQRVLDNMKLEPPSLDEGFDEIIWVNQ